MSDIPKEIMDAINTEFELIRCSDTNKRLKNAAIFGYHLRDQEINDLKIHNSFLNDENDGLRKLVKELEELINSLKIIADDE